MKQLPQLTFLRFLAAIWVIALHFWHPSPAISNTIFMTVIKHGSLGVTFFFVLSGFLLTWVYAEKQPIGLRRYVWARVGRVFPLYVLGLLAGMLVIGICYDRWPDWFFAAFQFSGLYAWWPNYGVTLNFPAWSVSVEFFLYACFPLLLVWLRNRSLMTIWVVAGVLWILGLVQIYFMTGRSIQWLDDPFDLFLLRWPPWHLNSFVLGMAGAFTFMQLRAAGQLPRYVTGIGLGIFGVLFILLFTYLSPLLGYAHNGLVAPIFLSLIFAVAAAQGMLRKVLSLRPLVFLGEISFAMYIFQAPCFYLMANILEIENINSEGGAWFWYAFAVLIAFSAAIHFMVERPLRKWIRQWGE